nr:MFS transporter [Klebsiella pneumoniae subsp. pneumoniae]
MLCGIPSNIMLAKVGARRWIAGIMVVWGSPRPAPCSPPARIRCTSCACWSASPRLVFCRGSVYLTWWFPAYHRARANALFMIAMPVTMMLGSILSGYILALDGLWNLKGWQWLFLLEGLPSVVLGVVLVLPQRHAG